MERRTILKAAAASILWPLGLFRQRASRRRTVKVRSGRADDDRRTLIIEIPIGSPGDPDEGVEVDWFKFVQVVGDPFARLEMRIRTTASDGSPPADPFVRYNETGVGPSYATMSLANTVRNSGGGVDVIDPSRAPYSGYPRFAKG